MVDECRAYGITPLDRKQFDAEEQQMYLDLMRRRRGNYGHVPSNERNLYHRPGRFIPVNGNMDIDPITGLTAKQVCEFETQYGYKPGQYESVLLPQTAFNISYR